MVGVIVPCIIIFYIHVLYTCCDCLFVCLVGVDVGGSSLSILVSVLYT